MLRVYIDFKSVEIACDLSAQFVLTLEPGIWAVTHNKTEFAITTLTGRMRSGQVTFTYPRGVERRSNGAWAARERIVPVTPQLSDMPPAVREALNDAYLLQRHDLIENLGDAS